MSQPKKTLPFIAALSEQLKPLSSPEDLVTLGVAGSTKTLANHRSTGIGPDFIKLRGSGVRYPKASVLLWLERNAVVVKQGRPTGRGGGKREV
jgi:hypothetical protein